MTPAVRESRAANLGAEVFGDPLRLIGSDSVDADVIASHDASHYEQVSASRDMELKNEQTVRLVIIFVTRSDDLEGDL